MTRIHGHEYATQAEVSARIEELRNENARYGDSDGRVTELAALTTADVAPKPQPPLPTRRGPSIAHQRRMRNENFSVHYTDEKGHKKRRGYVTREGLDKFLESADSRGYCVIAYA